MRWLAAFGLTLLIELPIYGLLLRRWCGTAGAVAIGIGVNIATHPAFWFGATALLAGRADYWLLIGLGELLVWAVEWLLLRWLLHRRGAPAGELAVIAGIANLTSALIGLVVEMPW